MLKAMSGPLVSSGLACELFSDPRLLSPTLFLERDGPQQTQSALAAKLLIPVEA